jgi:hypothetical protein
MFVPHEFTEYEFVMQWSPPAGGDRRWVVRRRFREFSALDKSLDETLPESVQLPQVQGILLYKYKLYITDITDTKCSCRSFRKRQPLAG